jgi:uroporphyrinogen decarboxylase
MAKGQEVERSPVWLMRQAGRYLSEYRSIRQQYSFLDMARIPALSVEITLQPIRRFHLDAAIIFSDILVIPEALGISYDIVEKVGPVFARRVESRSDLADLRAHLSEVPARLEYFYAALRILRSELASFAKWRSEAPALIGFAGAPWTLASYMVEGQSKTDLERTKALAFSNPEFFDELISILEEAVVCHLQEQIKNGAQMVQIFESFAGNAPSSLFERYCLAPGQRIISRLQAQSPVPVSYFARGAAGMFNHIGTMSADVLSIDWSTDIGWARKCLGDKFCLQGNLDPLLLLTNPRAVRREVELLMERVGPRARHIVNLGHGIVPQSNPENVRALVDAVHEFSPSLYR